MLLCLVACNAGPAGPDLTPFACTLTVQAEGVDLSGRFTYRGPENAQWELERPAALRGLCFHLHGAQYTARLGEQSPVTGLPASAPFAAVTRALALLAENPAPAPDAQNAYCGTGETGRFILRVDPATGRPAGLEWESGLAAAFVNVRSLAD